MVNTKGIRAFLQDSKAVSPAIATLILIVVAAVAAAAIGVMVQSSQEDAGLTLTEKSAEVEGKISTKGSTTVLPISQLAAVGFMSTNPSYQVSVAAGGSGVGRMLVYTKAVDIGASSDPWPTTEKTQDGIKVPHRKDAIIQEAGPDATIWETKIGTGLIVMGANIPNGTSIVTDIKIVNNTGTDQLDSRVGPIVIKFDTLRAAYNGTASFSIIDSNNVSKIIKLFQRSDPGGSEEVFAAWINVKDSEGYLPSNPLTFGAQGNQGIRDSIASTEYSMGFVDIGYTQGGANGKENVIPATMNGVVASKDTKGLGGEYDAASKTVSNNTKSLARDLYYYSYGVPKGAVKMFLDYIVSPAGQNDVKAAGFFSP
ncbi:MAG: substrate-binding domain-containing protein [Euryarchaeota archaeon]|nr:substrate-binding domain-containing protein [Euryarchaeota archaeon]MBU4340306.1 substrate-binding domain-containing protein [Euryarchaeota archaeon]MCG2736844.1 substrate-binding domain-containing protein [Candidatus Methanoperedenaceae archaeon]